MPQLTFILHIVAGMVLLKICQSCHPSAQNPPSAPVLETLDDGLQGFISTQLHSSELVHSSRAAATSPYSLNLCPLARNDPLMSVCLTFPPSSGVLQRLSCHLIRHHQQHTLPSPLFCFIFLQSTSSQLT